MLTVILAVFLFAVMIFPHELGHFLAAKSVGVQVNEFSFGMGPALWKKQKGETLYAIRLLPIGGYCAMEGEDEDTENAGERAFVSKSAWQKIYVLAAGACMNILICLVILTAMAGVNGVATTKLGEVITGMPAQEAGLQTGDRIVAINDTEVHSWNGVLTEITSCDGTKSLSIRYERDGKIRTASVQPVQMEGRYQIGITTAVSRNPFLVLKQGLVGTWSMAGTILQGMRMLLTGGASVSELSGPVGIVSVVHSTMKYGLSFFFGLMALISVNLAVVNLLPLPALDGGRILFVLIRKISGDRITDHQEGIVHFIGFVLLMGLALAVTWNDILRLLGK